jgi:hypothetical protein
MSRLSFQLVFDNYTAAPGFSDALPATSHSRKTSVDDFFEDSSSADPLRELNELRQQLQLIKKQTLVVMEQSRKSSKHEWSALQQAQEALKLKDDAIAKASRASERENYMLDLMTDASQDMSGTCPWFLFFFVFSLVLAPISLFPCRFFYRCRR